jgi:hypothetical protein
MTVTDLLFVTTYNYVQTLSDWLELNLLRVSDWLELNLLRVSDWLELNLLRVTVINLVTRR